MGWGECSERRGRENKRVFIRPLPSPPSPPPTAVPLTLEHRVMGGSRQQDPPASPPAGKIDKCSPCHCCRMKTLYQRRV
ncbi:hypothetical protein E2C01_094744 [Portunus trituberculatus]|uniref:Uncharacterized protein n=1 Tax=Portunus trituberculatus TaxID=210409 RepID=A0A5B7JYG0_PORTR|nr:hypothetical protein [Portunus trituberculatus]